MHKMGDYVTSTFQYLQWQKLYEKEKPFLLLRDVPPDAQDQRKNNLVFEDVEKVIRNTRDQKDSFTLDEHGFSYRIQYSKVASFSDQAYVDKVYLPEMEKLIKESVEGADKIFLFDWRVCRPRKLLRSPHLTKADTEIPRKYWRQCEPIR